MADAKTAIKKKVAGDSPEHRVQIAVTADTNRLVPLAQGRGVWYFDPITNKCLHLDTSTTAFAEARARMCGRGRRGILVARTRSISIWTT